MILITRRFQLVSRINASSSCCFNSQHWQGRLLRGRMYEPVAYPHKAAYQQAPGFPQAPDFAISPFHYDYVIPVIPALATAIRDTGEAGDAVIKPDAFQQGIELFRAGPCRLRARHTRVPPGYAGA